MCNQIRNINSNMAVFSTLAYTHDRNDISTRGYTPAFHLFGGVGCDAEPPNWNLKVQDDGL